MNRSETSETVIRIEPEKLTHERENVPPIEWTPANAVAGHVAHVNGRRVVHRRYRV